MQVRVLLFSTAIGLATASLHAQNTFPASGNVGIGTTSPQQRLHVEGTLNQAIFVSTTAPGAASGSGVIGYVKATPTAAGQRLGYLLFGSRGGAQNGYNQAGVVGYVSGAWSSTSHPAYLSFETTPSGATTRVERVRIDQNGHLVPGDTKKYDLGSSSLSWRNLYLRDDIYLDGTRFVSNAPGTASFNAFLGSSAGLAVTTGVNNAAFGDNALRNDTSGANNAALGAQALYANTSGQYNTAAGYAAMYNHNGFASTASGAFAMYTNSTGSYNTGYGADALYNNTTGSYNTAVGLDALRGNIDANYSTALGFYSGLNSKNASYATFLGADASAGNQGLTNVTAVGYDALVTASNQVALGNTSVTSVWAAGSYMIYSDGRFKRDLKEDVPGLLFINKLRPVTYHYKIQELNSHLMAVNGTGVQKGGVLGQPSNHRQEDASLQLKKEGIKAKEQILYTGFVAQEVEQAAQEMKYDFSGVHKPASNNDVYGLSYADFVVPLVKAVQELDQKTKKIEELEARIAKLETLLTEKSNSSATTLSSAYLEPASPNPARGTALIRYGVPENTAAARLAFTNANGQLVKEVSLSGRGTGQVNVNTTSLAAGTYNYTLWVNGQQADSKQLVIAR